MKKLFKIFKLVSITAILIGGLITPTFAVLAQPNQNPYVPLAPIPGTTESCSGVNCGTQLPTYLTGMFKVGIVLSGVLAFLMIVLGGFQYLSTDALTGKEEGRERIERAIGGLVLALTSYIILYSINPALVNLDLNFGGQLNKAQSLPLPKDFDYQKSFDNAVSEVEKNLKDTKATAYQLDQEKNNAKRDYDAIMDSILAEGKELTPEEQEKLDKLSQKIIELDDKSASIKAYNVAKDNMKIHEVNAMGSTQDVSWWKSILGVGSSREDVDTGIITTITAINNKAQDAKDRIGVAFNRSTDSEVKQQYLTWMQDLEKYQSETISNICTAWGKNAKKPPCN